MAPQYLMQTGHLRLSPMMCANWTPGSYASILFIIDHDDDVDDVDHGDHVDHYVDVDHGDDDADVDHGDDVQSI